MIGRRFDFELLASLLDETSEDQCLVGARRGAPRQPDRGAARAGDLPVRACADPRRAVRRDAGAASACACISASRRRSSGCMATTRRHGCRRWRTTTTPRARPLPPPRRSSTRRARRNRPRRRWPMRRRRGCTGSRCRRSSRRARSERCELLVALGEVLLKAAEHEAAIEAFTEAAKIARRIAAPAALARAALGYETCVVARQRHRRRRRGAGQGGAGRQLAARQPAARAAAGRAVPGAGLCRSRRRGGRDPRPGGRDGAALGDAAALFAALSAIVPARWTPELLPMRLAPGARRCNWPSAPATRNGRSAT